MRFCWALGLVAMSGDTEQVNKQKCAASQPGRAIRGEKDAINVTIG
jgi:hypothetical protein